MDIKISEIAELINGEVIGDKNITINNLARIQDAKKGELTFLYLSSYEKYLKTTQASAIIISEKFITERKDIIILKVKEPDKAFVKVIEKYFTPELKFSGIDKTAFVDDKSQLGKNITIGKNVVISDGCKIGDNTKILHNTVILENVIIGSDTIIYPNVSIRENSKIGSRVIIHSGTVVGSDGFGFNPDENGVYHKVPQIGNVVIEDDVELGSNVSIDRAAIGSTIIKKGVKIDNLVQVAHNVTIGENTVIASQTGISGSTKIGNNCILAGQVGIVGHIEIDDNVIIMAKSGIPKSINKPGKYFGYPAKELNTALRLEAHIRNLPNYSDKIKKLESELELLRKELNKKNS